MKFPLNDVEILKTGRAVASKKLYGTKTTSEDKVSPKDSLGKAIVDGELSLLTSNSGNLSSHPAPSCLEKDSGSNLEVAAVVTLYESSAHNCLANNLLADGIEGSARNFDLVTISKDCQSYRAGIDLHWLKQQC